jgi:hypothetical protein
MGFFDEIKYTEDDFKKKEQAIFPTDIEIAFRIDEVKVNNEKKYLQIITTPEKCQQHITKKYSFFFNNNRKISLLAVLKAFFTQQEIISGEWAKKIASVVGQEFVVKFAVKKVVGNKTYQDIVPNSLKILLDEQPAPVEELPKTKIEDAQKKGF